MLFASVAHASPVVTAQNGLSCAGIRYGKTLNCNAGEFAAIVNLSHAAGGESCTEGGYFVLDAIISMENSKTDRYNVGFFTGEHENDPRETTGQCSVATFPTSPDPWFNADGNVCGDFRADGQSTPIVQNLRVLCTGNSAGQLTVPYVVSYQQNSSACSGPVDVAPGSPSKCNSGTAVVSNVVVKPRPAAYYRFDEQNWTGAVGEVKDSSPNGLDGRAVNGATTAGSTPAISGNPGTCRYGAFNDGLLGILGQRYVQVPHNDALVGESALTYAAWIRPSGWNLLDLTSEQVIMSKSAFASGAAAAQMGMLIKPKGLIFLTGVELQGRVVSSSGVQWDISTPLPESIIDQWTHVALVFEGNKLVLYVNGAAAATATRASAVALKTNTAPLTIGNENNGNKTFEGYIDEVRVYTTALNSAQVMAVKDETHPCAALPSALDHVRLTHDGSAISCSAEAVTVQACGDADCTVTYGDGVSGYITAGNNRVPFMIPGGATQTTVSLHLPSSTLLADPQSVRLGASTVVPAPFSGSSCVNTGTGLSNDTTACDASVYKAGFLFDVPHLVSGLTSAPVEIQAVRSGDANACVPLFQNVTRGVALWGNYADPGSGTIGLLINGSGIDTLLSPHESHASLRSLQFDAEGKAKIEVRYDDVGLMLLNAQYAGSQSHNPPDAGLIVRGSDSFVVKPHHFELSEIRCSTADAANCGAGALSMPVAGDNPQAVDASGPSFIRAGHPFSVSVTAMNAFGQPTRNFGQETTPEGVVLSASLVAGLGLTENPALTNPSAFSNFVDGKATGTTFSWSEVGIIQLTPQIAPTSTESSLGQPGSYLGAGDVIGNASVNIGRFIPHHFDVTTNAPLFQAACSDFTYLNQEFGYHTPPAVTITARAANGALTKNYSGDFWKLTALTGFGQSDVSAPGGVDIVPCGAPSCSVGHTPFDCSSCNGVLTTTLEGRYLYTRTSAATAPFGAAPAIRFDVRDSDSVIYGIAPGTYQLTVGFWNGYNGMRSGRVYAQDVYGTAAMPGEVLNLPLYALYFDGLKWVANTSDSCSTFNYSETEDDIHTALAPTGTGGFLNGSGLLAVQVTSDPGTPGGRSSILFPWSISGPAWFDLESTPSASAVFGIYRGDRRLIHWREAP